MPSRFSAGLAKWPRSDGKPNSASWENIPTATIFPADQDFDTCVEMVKTEEVSRIRYTGNTPMMPGVYLRVSARVKVIADCLPFGGWARNVDAIVAEGPITGPAGGRTREMPFVTTEQGASKRQVRINWATPTKGRMNLTLRMDEAN